MDTESKPLKHVFLRSVCQYYFPPTVLSLAYGSAVFQQHTNALKSQKMSENEFNSTKDLRVGDNWSRMSDLIFVVNDGLEWHTNNMQRNGWHYVWLPRLLGVAFIATAQRWGPGVWFNSFVKLSVKRDSVFDGNTSIPEKLMPTETVVKYGVIERGDLVEDLIEWTSIYVAGRMHKPTAIYLDKEIPDHQLPCYTSDLCAYNNYELSLINTFPTPYTNVSLHDAMQLNWHHAVRVALCLLPENKAFTLRELFICIAALSYTGDIRVDSPHKITSIVDGALKNFIDLYKPILEHYVTAVDPQNPQQAWYLVGQLFTRVVPKHDLYQLFPKNLVEKIELVLRTCEQYEEIFIDESLDENDRRIIKRAIGKIVRPVTIWQVFKGLIATGLFKAILYAFRKLLKRIEWL